MQFLVKRDGGRSPSPLHKKKGSEREIERKGEGNGKRKKKEKLGTFEVVANVSAKHLFHLRHAFFQ